MLDRHVLVASALVAASSAVAQGDRSFTACPSQHKLEQVVGSQNRFTPDDCRRLTITRVQSGKTELCVLDFGRDADAGFLDQLKRAAVPQQWWVTCDDLSRR
jgi:hypothetical protein